MNRARLIRWLLAGVFLLSLMNETRRSAEGADTKGTVMSLEYRDGIHGITAEQLRGLHAAWPKPPSPETFLKSLRNMNAVELAIDPTNKQVVGFVCGMTDRVLVLYIWDLEVLPTHQKRGVEEELARRFLKRFGELYQVNIVVNASDVPFWSKLGFHESEDRVVGMTKMNTNWQDGGPQAVK